MTPEPQVRVPAPRRRPAGDIIEAVLENLRSNLEPLRYTVLAPSRFVVYLHPAEHARLEGILPVLEQETVRALTEELARLNRRAGWRRHVDRLLGGHTQDVHNAATGWHVEFLSDPDGELSEGDILIDSELLLPGPADLGAGERTRRVTTRHVGGRGREDEPADVRPRTSTRVATVDSPAAATPVYGRLRYEDNAGVHSYDIARDSVTVGRGGLAYRVDVRVEASADVSREHMRLRRDPATGRFFVVDLSSLGTSVDGRRVPRGFDEADGAKRENGTETALGDRARIGLADTVFLDFEASKR